MKTKLITTALLLTINRLLLAQTADDYVSQGRAFLAATNIVAANNSFSNAVALSPNHQTANVFYAATRLLVLPSQPAGSNFLSRIGMPAAGRDIYNWTAELPTDTNGVPLAPVGVNANESTAMLRTNVLPVLIAAEANLVKVTDTNFTLILTSDETRIVGVILDFGDIRMLRAMLQAGEYFAYTTYSWNLDAQLAAIRSLYTNDQLSIERVLMDYPNLLTFATTNDLNAAKLAFQNGVNRYMEASQFIRNRSTNVTRLFNYDAGKAADEEKFRFTLTDLTNSLSTAVTLAVDTNYTVFLGAHFSGTHTLRSFLPWFRGSGFGLGTLPDPTFGGLIYGLTGQGLDESLAKHLLPIPTISPVFSTLGGQFQFPINVAKGRGYVIQVSTNLLDWSDYSAFFAFDGGYSFADPNTAAFSRRFYRVVDRTGNMPPAANDAFANRALIANMNVPVYGYTESASLESAETNRVQGIGHTVWWTWTSPVSVEVAVLASGGDNCWPIGVFTGVSLNGLTQVASDYNQVRFTAQAGVTYQIAVDTCWQDGGVKLVITRPPVLVVNSPSDGATFYPPANLLVSGSASDPDGQIRQIRIFSDFMSSDFNFNYTTTADSFSIPWTNVPGGYYYLDFVATDDVGCQAFDYRFIRVHPPNDDFTNATPISGAPLIVTGSNAGANKEAGEPNHAGTSGGTSIWWSWTPASTGPVTILCDLTNQWGSAWPLLGVYTGSIVSNLTSVASNAPNYGTTAVVSFAATLGQTYKIAVDSYDQGTAILQFIATAAPTVAITNPLDNATFIGPTNIQISAQASDSDGSIARVEFYADGSLVGTRLTPPYSVTWSNVPPDGYSRQLVAYAVDNAGVGVFSAPVNVTVQPPPPPNDNFANRITISGTNVTTSGTNVGATRETGEPFHWSSTGGKSVWWTWQAQKSGTVTITTAGSSFDTILAAYTGNAVGSLSLVANNDDYNGFTTSRVTFLATSGTVYQIAVDGYGGSSGSIVLSIVQP
jgi:hypothetical protein